MAATPKTMAEVLASSMPPLKNKNSGNDDFINSNEGKSNVEMKEENDSSGSIMIKTYPFLTITVYIPTACVGVLIGKRGSNIDSIQKLAAKESAKAQTKGHRNNTKNPKQTKGNNNNGSVSVSSDSVRISVVNYPPPPSDSETFDQHFKNLHSQSMESGNTSGQQQSIGGGSSAMMDMGVPPTYTELDFSDPQWTPIVIRADPIAAIHAANAIHDICCPEYVVDRNQLVYILDVPVPAVASTANANLRHASIVGKRGNKLIQLSADHKCRIMVPPKQLGHDVIQLEAPLKECCSCLKAITSKLQPGGTDEGDANKTSPSSPNSKITKNNPNSKGNNKKNENSNNNKMNFQTTLIIQPLPSQTKLRNIARKTETKILKKRIPKSQQNNSQKQTPPKQDEDADKSQPEQPSEEQGGLGDEPQENQDEGANNNTNGNSNGNDSKLSWRLTVIASTEKRVTRALDMLKVLGSKGYEVILEESGVINNNSVETFNKNVTEGALGGAESDADAAADDGGPKPATTNGHGGRGGGRGGRNKKQRYRNNHKGNNGKDNSGKQSAPAAAVGDV